MALANLIPLPRPTRIFKTFEIINKFSNVWPLDFGGLIGKMKISSIEESQVEFDEAELYFKL